MFAFNQLRAWADKGYTWFTAAPDYPDYEELNSAVVNVYLVQGALFILNQEVARQYPGWTEFLIVIDKVRHFLVQDAGGTPPWEVLAFWQGKRAGRKDAEIFNSPEEKAAMLKIWERWRDSESIESEFWGLQIYNKDGTQKPITVEVLWTAKHCLDDWLAKRRAGKLD